MATQIKQTNTGTASRAKRKSVVDPNETKAAKFKRLCRMRMPKALDGILSIARLAGPGYEFTPEQANRIVGDLQARVDVVKKAFASGGPGRSTSTYNI